MKKITTLLLLMSFIVSYAQKEIELANRDGLKITYQLIEEDEGKRKDKYILIVNAINESDDDIYYEVAKALINGVWTNVTNEEQGFTKIKVRNSTGWFGDGRSLIGDPTDLRTTSGTFLYVLKKGNIYTDETKFNVKSGKKPIITNSFTSTLQPLSGYDIALSPQMLEGNYTSSCGNTAVSLKMVPSPDNTTLFLLQTTNGSQFTWIPSSETTYSRQDSPGVTIVYDQNSESYTYTTSDGISCTWSKN